MISSPTIIQTSHLANDIQAWLTAYLAQALEMDTNQIDVTLSFDSYGLDSAAIAGLTGDLANWLNQTVDITALYDYPSITTLAQHLAKAGH